MSTFYIDISKKVNVTWEQLLTDISVTDSYNKYCYHSEIYDIVKHIVVSMLLGKEIVLLDNDLTQDEIYLITNQKEITEYSDPIVTKLLLDNLNKESLISKLNKTSQNWLITLYTSGTTGKPKKISHSFSSITRFIQINDRYKSDVWGLAYNPTHMAGLQVLLQAILNGNQIARLFGLPKEVVFNTIAEQNVTHISATPTFYKLLLPNQLSFDTVKKVTSGGEKFDVNTFEKIKLMFPKAKVTNIYASTEAGVILFGNGDVLRVKDTYRQFVTIKDQELLIHRKLIGKLQEHVDEWYHTGDIVEVVAKEPLAVRFVARRSDIINIGGYNVNPNEVEELISKLDGIVSVHVFSKANSVLGNILCCNIYSSNNEIDELYIRTYLKKHLQEFKIPRIITFTDSINTTRSGKIKRSKS